jgi:outer membrane protein assembly factor BamB
MFPRPVEPVMAESLPQPIRGLTQGRGVAFPKPSSYPMKLPSSAPLCSLVVMLGLVPAGLSAAPALAAPGLDWPSYRGPNGDGVTQVSPGKPWESAGPKEVWKVEASNGFSSIAVAGGLAATLVTREAEGSKTECCVALDPVTGKELWAMPLKLAKYQGGGDSGTSDNGGGDGPRTTPAISDGKVYVYGSNLDLYCFDAKSGKMLWSKDVAGEYKGKNISWSNATSPLIEGDLVIVGGGGKGAAFLAFDKKTGAMKWKEGDDTITHATPTATTILGERQIIFFMKSGLTAVSPKGGKVLWHQDYKFNVSTAASPVVFENVVYCSAGYGVGSAAYEVKKSGSKFETTELWRVEGDGMNNHWSTPVAHKGYLYGMFSFKKYGEGPVKCVDIRTGKEMWSKEGFGPGNLVLANDKLVALSDKGELVMIEPKPDAYTELARADVLEGKCWSTPTLAKGFIFARSTKEAACFAVAP